MKHCIFIILLVVLFNNFCVSQTGWVSQQIGSNNYIGIIFYNSNSGLIFGQTGTILKTTNKGLNWITYITNAPGPAKYGHAVSDSIIGLIIDYGGSYGYHALYTTNAGTNWIQASIQPVGQGIVYLTSIFILDRLNAYACGAFFTFIDVKTGPEGIIYKTTNGGINWVQSLRWGVNHTDIKFLNNNTGAVIGGGSFMRTTNGGTNWQLISSLAAGGRMSNPFQDTFYTFSDYNIARTTNYGINFTLYQTNNPKPLRGIYFVNSKYGFAVGDSGTVIKTTNAGINWTAQNSATLQNINSVWFLNKDTGFAVCNNGYILKTFSGGASLVHLINNSVPVEYSLNQNYPNPFNPATKIKFDIPNSTPLAPLQRGTVSLKVYDITGKEVAVLVNEALQPGTYEVTFDGNNLTSGVYFYKLQAGEFTETRKMALIK